METEWILSRVRQEGEAAMADAAQAFARIEQIAQDNTEKVLAAFRTHRVSDTMFAGTTGYGYDDRGRDVLDEIYAEIFGAEAALVRTGFVNGTHALTAALFACLAPGDVLLSITGAPYDTLLGAIGVKGERHGSLRFYGVGYQQVELLENGEPDYPAIAHALDNPKVRTVFLQRSRGYTSRPALSIAKLAEIIEFVRGRRADVVVMVDNCYGEFVESKEPTQVGADLMAGSLIKNPGGGLAPTGGYVAGRKDLVEAASFRLTVPGIGGECGATMGVSRSLYQGLFMAPHTVAQALKTAVFAAALMHRLGYKTYPEAEAVRSDIVQVIEFGDADKLKRFCLGIQQGAPVDSFVTPEAWDMPGYDCPVIMAAGAFIQGASIELSADGPMKPPYRAYMQGGLTFESGKLGILRAASLMEQ